LFHCFIWKNIFWDRFCFDPCLIIYCSHCCLCIHILLPLFFLLLGGQGCVTELWVLFPGNSYNGFRIYIGIDNKTCSLSYINKIQFLTIGGYEMCITSKIMRTDIILHNFTQTYIWNNCIISNPYCVIISTFWTFYR